VLALMTGGRSRNVAVPTFRDVYLANFDFVWGILRRLGVREEDSQDVTQKVFLIVHRKLSEFESRAGIRTWLYGICINAARGYRNSAPIRHEVAVAPEQMAALIGAADEWHADSEFRREATIAEIVLDKLPGAPRLIFVLFELEDLSGSEIASLLGISIGTVRSRMRLARETFKRELKRLALKNQFARTTLNRERLR